LEEGGEGIGLPHSMSQLLKRNYRNGGKKEDPLHHKDFLDGRGGDSREGR